MSPERWERVKELFERAVALPPAERLGLVYAAEADPVVVAETARLLALEAKPDSPIDRLAAPMQQLAQEAAGRRVWSAGQMLAGRFRVIRWVGSGGIGEVYEAEDLEEGQQVALKTLRAEFRTVSHAAWLRREVESAKRVRHPNVCRVFGFWQGEEETFLTMEFLEGETLGAVLAREGPFPERRALPVLRQIAAGLAAAHEAGVVHRDLKPSNVMMVPRVGGTPRVVITDFGLARQTRVEGRNTASVALSTVGTFGTPAYMAPEQIAGQGVGPAADQYAFGVLAHEMLTGELPFADESALAMAVRKANETVIGPEALAPGIRLNWSKTILRCLDPNPKKRFSRVGAVLEGLETRGTMELQWKLLRRQVQRYPRWRQWGAVGAVLLLFVGAMLWRAWPGGQVERQWQEAIYSLQSDEAWTALRQMEEVSRSRPLGQVEKAQESMAWWAAGLPEKARTRFTETSTLLLGAGDRVFVEAVGAQLRGDNGGALRLLRERAEREPETVRLWADLAWFGSLQRNAEAKGWWKRVKERQPDHPVAILRLAEESAKDGETEEARDGFQAAETYFRAGGNAAMAQVVKGRRGLLALAAGDLMRAQAELTGTLVSGRERCSSTVTMMAGSNDQFAAPPDPVPFASEGFVAMQSVIRRMPFDDPDQTEGQLFLSFPLPSMRLCSAVVQIRIRVKEPNRGNANDVITFGVAPFLPSTSPDRIPLWSDRPELKERTMSFELSPALLAECMRAYAKSDVAYLDIHASDDTIFDFVRLTVIY
jgi:tetratricopeptide (TPR) repeat protein